MKSSTFGLGVRHLIVLIIMYFFFFFHYMLHLIFLIFLGFSVYGYQVLKCYRQEEVDECLEYT